MKKYTAILMVFIIIGLTGCAKDTVTLTEEQNNMVAEYIAGAVLRHDTNYKQNLLVTTSPEPVAEGTTQPSQEPNTSPDAMTSTAPGESVPSTEATTTVEASPVADVSTQLNDVYANSNINVSYMGYELYDSYPQSSKDSDFSLQAKDEDQLLVVKFNLENTSDKKQSINFLQSNIKYILSVDGSPIYEAAITPLLNDMQYLDVTLEPKAKQKTVVVFEVSKQLDLSQVELYVTTSDMKAVIDIK